MRAADGEASKDVGHDLFLDFLNRDTRQIFGIYRNVPRAAHVAMLSQALNFCAFMTRDRCIMPPGFLAEDPLVREVLKSKQAYQDALLIRLPIRESLDEFWAKKEREYRDVRQSYEGLFDRVGQQFVEAHQHLLLDRPFEIGKRLVADWESAPDSLGYWQAGLGQFSPTVIEIFRKVPRHLADEGKAVTWATISQQIPEVARRNPRYRRLVQHIYFSIYLQAFDLKVITGLPLIRDSFGLGSDELFYRFDAMKHLIAPTNLWALLLELPAPVMVELRTTQGYYAFRRSAVELCGRCGSIYRLKEVMALPSSSVNRILRRTRDADGACNDQQMALFRPYSRTETEAIGQRLSEMADLALDRLRHLEAGEAKRRSTIAKTRGSLGYQDKEDAPTMTPAVTLGVFSALREERDILVRTWNLVSAAGSQNMWTGRLDNGAAIRLYQGKRMGRVPAAVATARFLLANSDISALLILGIAGGFAEAGVEIGDILVPDTVADLATRKITSDGVDPESRVRPKPYELTPRLGEYLDSTFDRGGWVRDVCERVGWPENMRPRFGPTGPGGTLASVDEVVSSDHHRSALMRAWTDLLGVEMEAGGVLAAVREFHDGLTVFHIRAISDLADPAKSDSQWRRLGMETLAHLVTHVDWKEVLR